MKKRFFSSVLGVMLLLSGSFVSTINRAAAGGLECKGLSQSLSEFSSFDVGSYCSEAIQACRIQTLMDKTDKKNPLYKKLEEKVQGKTSLALGVCELAILVNDPQYHASHFKP